MTAATTACLSLLLFAGAQATTTVVMPQQPPRDASAPASKGTASIKGKVVTANGARPIRRVQITLTSPDLTESRSMSTNSQGIFEFTELPAGRYTLTASRGGYLRMRYGQRRTGEAGRPIHLADGQRVGNADFALPRASVIIGRVTDEVGDPLPGASVFPMQWKYFRGQRRLVPVPGGGPFNRTDDTGGFRVTGLEPGDYFVMATTRDAWNDETNPKERIGFLPSYAAGTANPADAFRIKVGLGEEVTIADFPMVPGRVGTISGTAISSSGMPLAGESVSMTQEFAGPSSSMSFGGASTKVAADGSFTIRNVSPGEYKISINAGGDQGRPMEAASMPIVMTGDNLAGVMLVTSSGGSVSGRVITDTGVAVPADQKMRVTAQTLDSRRFSPPPSADNGRVRDDMTFELTGVFGSSRFRISPLPAGWAVRSIEYGNKDLADTAVDVHGGERLENVTIILSKSLPRLRGTLLDGKGQPAEGTILLFPEDSANWFEESRLVKSARPDHLGAFEFVHVIPGDYFIAAADYIAEGDWADPAFLENLRDRAKRIRVNQDGAAAVILTLPSER